MMKLIIGTLTPTVFLCNVSSDKKIKKNENIHEPHILAIVQAHNSTRRLVR